MAKKKGNKKKISAVTTETNRILFYVAIGLMIIFFIGAMILEFS